MPSNMSIKTYLSKIDKYNNKELEEEYSKLSRLLDNIYQEYKDREDTIFFITRQMEEVKNRVTLNEEQAI